MSNVTQGMNVEEVRQLGADLQRIADDVQQIMRVLERQVGTVTWVGPDARAFKDQWWPGHRNSLRKIIDDLHGFGQSAKNNAEEQAKASGVQGAAGSTGGGGGTSAAVPSGTAPASGGPSGGAGSSNGVQGPQAFQQAHLVDVANGYIGQARATGWSQPGECIMWVNSWLQEAGGKRLPGRSDPFTQFAQIGAVQVGTPVPGDIFQRAAPGTWEGNVHTAVVDSYDYSTGKVTLIEGNVPMGSGRVGRKTYALSELQRENVEIRFYRVGQV